MSSNGVGRADLVPLPPSPFASLSCFIMTRSLSIGACVALPTVTFNCVFQQIDRDGAESVSVDDARSAWPLVLGAGRKAKVDGHTSQGGEEGVHSGADDGSQEGQSVQDVPVLRDPVQ